MTTGPVLRSQFLPLVLVWMRAHGMDAAAEELAAECGPPRAEVLLEVSLPLEAHRELCQRAAEIVGEPFLGTLVAAEVPRGHYGPFEFAARSAPTVGDALRKLFHFSPALNEIVVLEMSTVGDTLVLTHRIEGEPLCAGRETNEFALATLFRFVNELTGQHIDAVAVDFAHPSAGDPAPLKGVFGTETIRFGCGQNRLLLAAAVAALPVVTSDPALSPWMDRQAEALLPRAPTAQPAVPGLRERIKQLLLDGVVPSLEGVASDLHTTSRTLQRRLQTASSSFQAELDAVRHGLALEYLADASVSLQEVALRLQYADQRTFERAFRRWQGVTPRQHRRTNPPPPMP